MATYFEKGYKRWTERDCSIKGLRIFYCYYTDTVSAEIRIRDGRAWGYALDNSFAIGEVGADENLSPLEIAEKLHTYISGFYPDDEELREL